MIAKCATDFNGPSFFVAPLVFVTAILLGAKFSIARIGKTPDNVVESTWRIAED